MNFGDAISTCFKKYADFNGTAARPEAPERQVRSGRRCFRSSSASPPPSQNQRFAIARHCPARSRPTPQSQVRRDTILFMRAASEPIPVPRPQAALFPAHPAAGQAMLPA